MDNTLSDLRSIIAAGLVHDFTSPLHRPTTDDADAALSLAQYIIERSRGMEAALLQRQGIKEKK